MPFLLDGRIMKLIGLGAGGHAKVVIEILNFIKDYEIVGLLDPKEELWGTEVAGVVVKGSDALINELYEKGIHNAFIGLGTVGDLSPRKRLYENVRNLGLDIVNAIHPHVIISKSAKIGHGPTVMAGAIINSCVILGEDVIVNTGAIIEHDCVIGSHVHIATGARLASTVYVGDGTHIGIGAVIRQCIRIGSNALIGAGAVVVKDVANGQTVVGNPARPMEKSSNV